MKRTYIIIYTIMIALNVNAQQCERVGLPLTGIQCDDGNYHLIFEDNFDGNSLDLTKWKLPYQGVLNDFNFENAKCWLANTGNTPSIPIDNNIQISNGTLKLIVRKENPVIEGTVMDWSASPPAPKTDYYQYSSAWIETHEKFFYGKYEIKCRLPNGKGFWPAFWTYGGQRWNEIDVFEIYGSDIYRFTCNIHHDFDGDGHSESCSFAQNNLADFTQWHVFTCIFEKDRIVWEIDGVTVRILPRYISSAGNAIYCDDNIGFGTYFQLKSYPIEDMHLIVSIGVESGENAPDANTVFPNTYEIDYVRYYIKSEEAPCEADCLDHIIYENTNQLPVLTRADSYISANNNVVVQNGQNVTFKAPQIILSNGFSTQSTANFAAIIEECNYYNYEDIPVNFIGSNLIDQYIIIKCDNPIYIVEATGVLTYSLDIHTVGGSLVHQVSGAPTSNYINLWDASNIAEGWYKVRLELSNCSESDEREFNILVLSGDCSKMGNMNFENKDTESSLKSSNFSEELIVYPNPANNELNILYFENNENPTSIIISDINGKELLNLVHRSNMGMNEKSIDLGLFSNGTYILTVLSNNGKFDKKFVISR